MKHQPDLTAFRYIPYVIDSKRTKWVSQFGYIDRDEAKQIAREKAQQWRRLGKIVLQENVQTVQVQISDHTK